MTKVQKTLKETIGRDHYDVRGPIAKLMPLKKCSANKKKVLDKG